MKVLTIIGSTVLGLAIGMVLFFYVFGFAWSGRPFLACGATGLAIFLFGITARQVVGKYAYLPVLAVCTPFLFFTLGTMAGLREQPISFLFWSCCSLTMLAAGLFGGYIFPKFVAKYCKGNAKA